MIEFLITPVNFPIIAGIEQTISSVAAFPGTIRTAQIGLNGFDISFGNGEHPLERLRIDCNLVVAAGNVVVFNVSMIWKDSSGNIDDPFGGQVKVLVIADLL